MNCKQFARTHNRTTPPAPPAKPRIVTPPRLWCVQISQYNPIPFTTSQTATNTSEHPAQANRPGGTHPTTPDDTTNNGADGPPTTSGRFGRWADLTQGPVGRTLWRLATPLTFGFVINMVYAWTDMYFVSRLGDAATAALGFGDQIMFVVFSIGSGFCIGTGILIARRVGEQRTELATKIATHAFSFMLLYSTAIALAMYLLMPPLLHTLGLSDRVYDLALIYTSTLLFGFPANLITFQTNASVRSTGNTVFPMAVLLLSALLNGLMDPVLIFGKFGLPALGIRGAAISTSLAQWTGALICTYALYRGRLSLKLGRPTLRFDWGIIRSIFRIGIPASMQSLAVSTSRTVVISLANVFGDSAAAAYAIGQKVDALVYMPVFAVGIAIETLVGQNIGAGRRDRVKQFRAVAMRHLGLLMVACGVVVWFIAPYFASTFTDNPLVLQTTVDYLRITVFGYAFMAIGQTATRSLSGAGHSMRSMLIVAGMLYGAEVPLAYALSHWSGLRESGVFAAIVLAHLLYAAASSAAVRGDKWMEKKI